MTKTKEQKLIGKAIRIKNGEHEHGVIRHVTGEGRAATYEVRAMGEILYLVRDEFTLARR